MFRPPRILSFPGPPFTVSPVVVRRPSTRASLPLPPRTRSLSSEPWRMSLPPPPLTLVEAEAGVDQVSAASAKEPVVACAADDHVLAPRPPEAMVFARGADDRRPLAEAPRRLREARYGEEEERKDQ